MRIFKSIILFAFIALGVSCSNDDAPDQLSNNDILGGWRGTAVEYSGRQVTTGHGQTMVQDFDGEAYDLDYTLTFTENPNIVTSEGSYSLRITVTFNGQTTTQYHENLQFLQDGEWRLEGSTFYLTVDGQTQEYDIVELTNTQLVLGSRIEETIQQGEFLSTATFETRISFSR